jgi:hypothetical protein
MLDYVDSSLPFFFPTHSPVRVVMETGRENQAPRVETMRLREQNQMRVKLS